MSPAENLRFEELVSSYLDASLSDAQEYALLQMLESPAYGRAFIELTRVDREIKGLLAVPVSDQVMADVVQKEMAYASGKRTGRQSKVFQAVMDTIQVHAPRAMTVNRGPSDYEIARASVRISKPTTPWAMVISVAFHAALIVLILGLHLFGTSKTQGDGASRKEQFLTQAPALTPFQTARIETITGDTFRIERAATKAAQDNKDLSDGDALETVGLKSSAGIKYPDGSLVLLNPETRVSKIYGTAGGANEQPAKRFYVERGVISANVFKQPEGRPMTLLTSNAEATVIGTRFTLAAQPRQTRLEVTEGVVRLTRLGDKRFVYVKAGEYAVVADGVELAAKRLNPPRTFVMGVDFFGGQTTIEGNRWMSHKEALANGLLIRSSDNNTASQIVNFDPIPAVDADMRKMLNSRVYSMAAPIDFMQPLPNGEYEVVMYIFEPHRNGSRVFDVEINGALAKRGVGRLKMREWEKAVMNATVRDGQLNIHVINTNGNPAISGMAIFKLD